MCLYIKYTPKRRHRCSETWVFVMFSGQWPPRKMYPSFFATDYFSFFRFYSHIMMMLSCYYWAWTVKCFKCTRLFASIIMIVWLCRRYYLNDTPVTYKSPIPCLHTESSYSLRPLHYHISLPVYCGEFRGVYEMWNAEVNEYQQLITWNYLFHCLTQCRNHRTDQTIAS